VINALHAAGIKTFPLPENHSGLAIDIQLYEVKVSQKDVDAALEIIEEQENL